jgi:putative transposon-encoded protein
MSRKIELNEGKLILTDAKIEGFLERTVTPLGTSAKADVPKRFIGRRVYVIVVKD